MGPRTLHDLTMRGYKTEEPGRNCQVAFREGLSIPCKQITTLSTYPRARSAVGGAGVGKYLRPWRLLLRDLSQHMIKLMISSNLARHRTCQPRKFGNHVATGRGSHRMRIIPILLTLSVAMGCQAPSVSQQRLVSQPNMLFSDSLPLSFGSRLIPQLETGAAGSGGAANSGCTACR